MSSVLPYFVSVPPTVIDLLFDCFSSVVSARFPARTVKFIACEMRLEKIAKFRRTNYWNRKFSSVIRQLQKSGVGSICAAARA
jgi:hypothetical protein